MTEPRPSFENDLLDWHLGQLEDESRPRVERELEASADRQAQSRSVQDLLKLLDQDAIPPASPNLAARCLERIARQTAVLHLPDPDGNSTLPTGQTRSARGSWFTLRDLVAVAACVALLCLVAVPGYLRSRDIAKRQLCLDRLHQVSVATAGYAEQNAGFLPFADFVPEGRWLPAQAGAEPTASNTRHIYRLVKTGVVNNPQLFLCPSDRAGLPMPIEQAAGREDFPDRRNTAYSFIFMNYPQGRRMESMRTPDNRHLVLIADRNPHLPAPWPMAAPIDARRPMNSPLHGDGAGQNIIRADGSGQWATTPTVGIDGDDIYRAGNLTTYTGTEGPTSDTDTFLVP